MELLINEIMKLSPKQKLSIIDQIWKSLPKNKVSPPISEEIKSLLKARINQMKSNPNTSISIEESKKRVKQRIEAHSKNRKKRTK